MTQHEKDLQNLAARAIYIDPDLLARLKADPVGVAAEHGVQLTMTEAEAIRTVDQRAVDNLIREWNGGARDPYIPAAWGETPPNPHLPWVYENEPEPDQPERLEVLATEGDD